IFAFKEASERAGLHYRLGEGLSLGIFYYLADSRERAVREITPFYEEHVKMFGPLGFVPGITPAQLEASTKRGGWGAAGVPTVEDYMKVGAWFAGPPADAARATALRRRGTQGADVDDEGRRQSRSRQRHGLGRARVRAGQDPSRRSHGGHRALRRRQEGHPPPHRSRAAREGPGP